MSHILRTYLSFCLTFSLSTLNVITSSPYIYFIYIFFSFFLLVFVPSHLCVLDLLTFLFLRVPFWFLFVWEWQFYKYLKENTHGWSENQTIKWSLMRLKPFLRRSWHGVEAFEDFIVRFVYTNSLNSFENIKLIWNERRWFSSEIHAIL